MKSARSLIIEFNINNDCKYSPRLYVITEVYSSGCTLYVCHVGYEAGKVL